ncbi:MAG TPA: hypothetical protein VN700_18720 [Vicinamibacterales bacterium]|nr:hypothetical protein [Vicinamibacterales bacterium]
MISTRVAVCSALLVVASTTSGCSKADQAPPVASVAVTLNRQSAPLGAPIELTYRFDVAQGASIAGDYKVFVHITRDDGTTIWMDDHDLPAGMQTSQWKPGQTIQYTRTRFVPAFSYLGEATIRVGLYKDNERLPLSGIDPADRESPERQYKVATLDLLPRSESIQVIRLSGWHPGEFAPDDPTIEWQWTQKLALLSLRNPRRDVLLYLEYDGRPDLFPDKPQQVTVSVGQTAVETLTIDSKGTQLKKIPLTVAQLGTGDMVEVRIDVDRTFIPAKQPGGSRDSRELGIRVFHAFVEPR